MAEALDPTFEPSGGHRGGEAGRTPRWLRRGGGWFTVAGARTVKHDGSAS